MGSYIESVRVDRNGDISPLWKESKPRVGKFLRNGLMMGAVALGMGLGQEGKSGASATDIASSLAETQARNTLVLPHAPFRGRSVVDEPVRPFVRQVAEAPSRFSEEQARNFAQQFNTLKLLSGTVYLDRKRRGFPKKLALLGMLATAFLLNTCAPIVSPTALVTETAPIPTEMTPTRVEPTETQPAEIPINLTVFPPELAPTQVRFPTPPDFSNPSFLSEIFSRSSAWVSGVEPTGALVQNYLDNYKKLFDQMGVQLVRVFQFGDRNTTVGFNNINGRWYMTCVSAGDILSFRCDTRQPGWFLKPPQETPRYVWVGLPLGATPDSVKVRGYNTEYPIYAIPDTQGVPTSVLQGGTTAKGFTARSEFALPAPTEAAPTLTPEAQAAWDILNLQTKDQWQAQKIEGWGVGWVHKETGEQIVDFPVTFTNGQGKTTVVHQLCYKTQTEGKGLMTVLTCMSQPRAEHRLVQLFGQDGTAPATDDQGRAFWGGLSINTDFINGNPQLLAAMQSAAKGEKPLVLVQGELAGLPPEFNMPPEQVLAQGLKAEGMPFGVNMGTIQQGDEFVPAPVMIMVLPFEREGKVFALFYNNYEQTIDRYISQGSTPKSESIGIIKRILTWISDLTSDGYFPKLSNPSLERGRRLIDAIPVQLEAAGISVDMNVVK